MKHILAFLPLSDFGHEERTRVAGIVNIIAQSVLTGFVILFLPRAILGQFQLYAETLSVGVLIILSLVFLRREKILWAENILLWTLLAAIIYLMFHSGGLHNQALLGVPICLVFAGIALRTKYFYAFTVLTVLSIVVIGALEISGKLQHPLSVFTTYFDVIDIAIIVSVTAIAVRTLVINIFQGMHEAKKSELEIRQQTEVVKESEEKFRTLTEELPNMVYILKNDKIVYANEKCREFVGFTKAELYQPDFDVLTMIAPAYRSVIVELNHRLMHGEEIAPFECEFFSKGDDTVPCMYMAKVIHYGGEPAILCLITDLTEIRQVQQEIRESQNRLQSIITSVLEGIITLNEQFLIRSFNPAAETMFKCSAQEAVGQSISRFISFAITKENHESDRESIEQPFYETLEGKVQSINGLRVNGEQFPIEASMTKVKVGNEFLYTLVLRDITERLKSEEKQRELQSQLFQSQKMEAVGALAGGIAHDFNNLLSVIINNAELVKIKVQPEHPASKNIDQVLNGSERAQELVHQILAFSRKQEAELRPIRLHYILREGMKLLRASIPTTIQIKLELPSTGPLILADATQMHQVLMNLCTNSAHAIHGGNGMLIIRQKNVEFDDRAVLFHPDLRPGSYVMFSVQDNGQGMDGFTLKRVFEPFFTTKDPGKGTGLGLSIVHSIVKHHNGAVKVKSEPGKGTVVETYLPIYGGDEETLSSDSSKSIKGRGEKILIVDDEKPILLALNEILKHMGYTPTSFSSSVEALRAFEKAPQSFDVIITDQTMPHLTGVALAHRVTQIRKDIPIILMTGYDQLEDPGKIQSLGIKAIMLKPFKQSVLSENLIKVLKQEEFSTKQQSGDT